MTFEEKKVIRHDELSLFLLIDTTDVNEAIFTASEFLKTKVDNSEVEHKIIRNEFYKKNSSLIKVTYNLHFKETSEFVKKQKMFYQQKYCMVIVDNSNCEKKYIFDTLKTIEDYIYQPNLSELEKIKHLLIGRGFSFNKSLQDEFEGIDLDIDYHIIRVS